MITLYHRGVRRSLDSASRHHAPGSIAVSGCRHHLSLTWLGLSFCFGLLGDSALDS